MAVTFRAVVYADNKKQDGTYNVKIRVTHQRCSLKVSTSIFVDASELTRSLKIKSQDIVDQCDDLVRMWRTIVGRLGSAVESMTVKQIVAYIKDIELTGNEFKLDFIAYGRKVAASKSEGSARNYIAAINAIERFRKGIPLDISQVTSQFLHSFENFITSEPTQHHNGNGSIVSLAKSKGGRAISAYLSCIRHIHNEAKREYNDEDRGVIRIPQSPFNKYEVKKQPKARKRAVAVEIVQRIIDLDDIPRRDGSIVDFSRRDLARDCFLLSFALAGMNAADLYNCPAQHLNKEPIIRYNRTKTRMRRNDEAEMHIRVEPCIARLIDKYSDPTGERLFCFHRHYSTPGGFTKALGIGMKSMATGLELEQNITFYAARHTWATVGRSSALNIDKYTIHEGLNHVDSSMKVTDIYIDRDWSVIWDANAKIIGLFDWSKVLSHQRK